MVQTSHSFGANAYLNLAHEALLREGRPLTPVEMLASAEKGGFLPAHLNGATMHKTLAARLSVYIREKSDKSEFFRTAPATYFLHSLSNEQAGDKQYKVYVGNLRSKTIRREDVLVVDRKVLKSKIDGDYVPFQDDEFRSLYAEHGRFMDRREAEKNNRVKQFVTFTLVHNQSKLLVYRRGKFTSTSERLKGQLSIGFGGHVNNKDFTLFSSGGDALLQNAARELREELFLDDFYENHEEAKERANILGYINVDDSPDAEHHIAVLVAFNHKSPELPTKGELSINQLSWLDLTRRLNDVSDFDLWSGMILENIFQGRIKLEGTALNVA